MATQLDLYEALKDTLGEKAARMVTDSLQEPMNIATKDDVARLDSGVARLDSAVARLDGAIERLDMKIDYAVARIEQAIDHKCTRVEANLMRWMLTFFVPLWLGVWGTLAAVVLKS